MLNPMLNDLLIKTFSKMENNSFTFGLYRKLLTKTYDEFFLQFAYTCIDYGMQG